MADVCAPDGGCRCQHGYGFAESPYYFRVYWTQYFTPWAYLSVLTHRELLWWIEFAAALLLARNLPASTTKAKSGSRVNANRGAATIAVSLLGGMSQWRTKMGSQFPR